MRILPPTRAAVEQNLAISRRLAEQDPSNAGWQRDLAVAHSRVGDVFQAQGKLAKALPLYEEAVRGYEVLTELAADFSLWQQEKEWVERKLALCRLQASKREQSD